MHINKKLLYNNFIDIKNIANINILTCYQVLFSKKGILHNICFFLVIIIIIFHLISAIIFSQKDLNIIHNKIEDINYAIKNWGLVDEKENENENNKIERKKNKKTQSIISRIISKKINHKIHKNPKNKSNPPFLKGKSKKLNNKKEVFSTSANKMERNNFLKNSDKKDILDNQIKKKMIEKIKKIMEFDDGELNNLSYESALRYDKRTYCQYYISLVKTKHLLIFSFFNKNDYNSKIIKIDLFIIGFVIYYAVNALFFNENTIHKIYEDNGVFNFIYQFPQILYSSIISSILNIILKLLALSNDDIIDFKQNKEIKDFIKEGKKLKKRLKIKFFLYFILSYFVLLFFWYYITLFGAIYSNTQYHLLKDTLISFGLSLVYPFGFYLLPGLFRIPSLSNNQNKKECLYNFSKILQIF